MGIEAPDDFEQMMRRNRNDLDLVLRRVGGGSGSSQTKDYIPVWGRRVGYTSQSIPNITNATVTLNDEIEMHGGLVADGTSGILIEEAGWYNVNASVSYFPLTGVTTINYLQVYIAVNGNAVVMGNSGTTSALAEGGRATIEDIIELQAGDVITVIARHSSSPATARAISSTVGHKSILLVEKTEPKVAIQGIPTPLTSATRAIFDTVAQMNATTALEGVSAYNRENGLEYIREGGAWRPAKIFAQKYRSASQSIAGYTNVEPILDQDVNSGMNVAPANRIQVVTPGYYRVYGRTVYGAITSGSAYAHTYLIKLDSSGSSLGTLIVGEAMISTAYSAPAEATIIHYFNAGEMVKLETRHSVSSARPISPNGVASASILSMERLD